MDHEWGGWPEDESELHGSLGGDADTADLTDSGAGLTELDGGHDYVDDAHDAFGGFDDQPAEDPAALGGHEPLPDDTFGDQHDESYDLGGHDSGAHDEGLRPFDESLQDEGPHEEALAQVAGAADGDHLVGTDPDLDTGADDPGWHDTAFPPPLGWDQVPEPVDGFPWSDPDLLGQELADPAAQLPGEYGAPPVSELLAYAGQDAAAGEDPWAQLMGSEDPATGALARWWAPGG